MKTYEHTTPNKGNSSSWQIAKRMKDFSDKLKPASPTGPEILREERGQSNVPIEELANHLLSRNDFLNKQAAVLPVLEKDPLFSKAKQQNLSRPDRYHLGLARAKKLRRLAEQHNWDEEDVIMSKYLCDDVSPYMVHDSMFPTTVREQGSEEQRKYWLPKIEKWEAIGCYAQSVVSTLCIQVWILTFPGQS